MSLSFTADDVVLLTGTADHEIAERVTAAGAALHTQPSDGALAARCVCAVCVVVLTHVYTDRRLLRTWRVQYPSVCCRKSAIALADGTCSVVVHTGDVGGLTVALLGYARSVGAVRVLCALGWCTTDARGRIRTT